MFIFAIVLARGGAWVGGLVLPNFKWVTCNYMHRRNID